MKERTDRVTGRQSRNLALFTGMAVLLMLSLCVSQASAGQTLPGNPPTFTAVNDENGADDQPGQKDLSLQAVATPTPGNLWVMWQWDDTGLSGGNTGDACALFDNDADSKVNFAVCVTIEKNPATQLAASPRVYTCGDGKVDRCTSTSTLVSPILTNCATDTNATDPFHNGKKDTRAICKVDLADVTGTGAPNLINTCSYPSQSPTSDPSDCVLIPRDAFITIVKNATPNNTGTQFPFKLGMLAADSNPVECTITNSGSCQTLPIRSGVSYNLKELTPTNWGLDTPAPVCTGASGSNTSNGTVSGATISGIKAASDNVITCTYNNKQLTGAIKITKKRTGGSPVLQGAHFTIDGLGDHVTGADGTVCVDGLSLGNHTVNETQAPNGHSIPTPSSQVVNVATAGSCATTQTGVTFLDDLLPGTIVIKKFGADGTSALNGATFTLHNDISASASYVPGTDTATSFTCTGGVNGICSLFNVPQGTYWVVETTAPNGYNTAAPQNVTIGVGGSPGNGPTVTLEFIDLPADGGVLIEKTGLDGDPLDGAEFTLYVKNGDGSVGASTGLKCTTGAVDPGSCLISPVPLGTYWLIETVVPGGYEKAANRTVTVGLGSASGQGQTVEVEITNTAKKGTVSITKTDDAGTALPGATFTLYNDLSASSSFDPPTDTITSLSCQTAAQTGTCNISNVPLGDYWVVETGVPDHYDAAAPRSITVGLGTGNSGDVVDVPTFVDHRQHRVVVLACHEGTDTLVSSAVKIGSDTKQSLAAGSLSPTAQKALCDTAGANFGDISGHGKITAEVTPPGH